MLLAASLPLVVFSIPPEVVGFAAPSSASHPPTASEAFPGQDEVLAEALALAWAALALVLVIAQEALGPGLVVSPVVSQGSSWPQ